MDLCHPSLRAQAVSVVSKQNSHMRKETATSIACLLRIRSSPASESELAKSSGVMSCGGDLLRSAVQVA